MNDAMREYVKTRIPIFTRETGISLDDLQSVIEEMIIERNTKPKDVNFEIRMKRIESKVNNIIALMEREKKGI